jgi:hypothetical protein
MILKREGADRLPAGRGDAYPTAEQTTHEVRRYEKPGRVLETNGGTVSDQDTRSQTRTACDEKAGDG